MKTQNYCKANRWLLVLTIALVFLAGCQKNISDKETIRNNLSNEVSFASKSLENESAVVAIDWYKLMLRMILNANLPTPPNSRMFDYAGIALYEAVRNGIPGAVSLHDQLYQMPSMPLPENNGYAWAISANAALADITRDLFGSLTPANIASIDSLEKAYNEKLTPDKNSEVAARSRAFGKAVAAAIFDWSKSDNFDHVNDPYTPPVFPGAWVPTPPAFLPAAIPYQGNVRPFLEKHLTQAPPPPYTYSEDPSSDYYKMAKDIYDASKSLTEEQTTIALFWGDPSGLGVGYTPPGHEMAILTQVLENMKASLSLAAQVYVKAGIAQNDATLICFRAKYADPRMRPVTYVEKFIDPTWLLLLFTPPHPEWPAAHAFITPATLEAIASVLGKNFAFTDHTYDFNGLGPRSYSSFDDAALECGISRFYGGIHYKLCVEKSHDYGIAIGDDAANVQLIK